MHYIPDIHQIPLNPRPGYDAMIISGQPQAAGRIISLSKDRSTARVVWRGIPGTYAFKPHPRMIDVAIVVYGRVAINCLGWVVILLGAGLLFEIPRDRFDLEIIETFIKVSFLYTSEGLTLQAKPLSD